MLPTARRIRVAAETEGLLEYLEDPTGGLVGMASVAQQAPMPLATNMCVTAFEHLPAAVASVGRTFHTRARLSAPPRRSTGMA